MISPEVVKVSSWLVDLAENPIIDAASPTTISIFGGLVLMTMKDIQFNYLFPRSLFMAVVTRAERKRRRCDALARLTSGMGVSQVTETLVRDYGITRRSANLDISWASTQIVKNLDKHEKKDLMAWLLTQSERTFQRSFENGQYSSAIGALKLIYEMTIKDTEKKSSSHHGNYKH